MDWVYRRPLQDKLPHMDCHRRYTRVCSTGRDPGITDGFSDHRRHARPLCSPRSILQGTAKAAGHNLQQTPVGITQHTQFLAHMSVGTMPHDMLMRSIELFGTVVAPAVRKALKHRYKYHKTALPARKLSRFCFSIGISFILSR